MDEVFSKYMKGVKMEPIIVFPPPPAFAAAAVAIAAAVWQAFA
jgi:hypothetical protein